MFDKKINDGFDEYIYDDGNVASVMTDTVLLYHDRKCLYSQGL